MKCCKIFSMVIISLCMFFAGGFFIAILCKYIEPNNLTMAFIISDFSLIAVIGILNIIFIIFEEDHSNEVKKSKIDKLTDSFENAKETILQSQIPSQSQVSQTANSYRQLEILENCFKAYANAIADI